MSKSQALSIAVFGLCTTLFWWGSMFLMTGEVSVVPGQSESGGQWLLSFLLMNAAPALLVFGLIKYRHAVRKEKTND